MTELSIQQRGAQICHWCTKEMPKKAINCPYCGKLREDIRRDTVSNYTFAAGTFFSIIFLIMGMKKGWWHAAKRESYTLFGFNFPSTHYQFSLEKFLSSGLGVLLSICFMACLIATVYYGAKVARKRGTSFWAP